MCKENQTKPDVYDWVLSPEIREHMRTARPLTVEEKADIIDSGCRPIVDKYAALTALLREADREEDKAILTDLLKLYGWAFEELHSRRPEQVFIFQETWWKDDPLDHDPCGVQGVFRTYEELTDYLKEYEGYYEDPPLGYPDGIDFRGYVEKWAEVDGKMQSVLGLNIFLVDGKIIIQDFDPWYLESVRKDGYKELGIRYEAERIHSYGTGLTTFPIPFRSGDLVQVEVPSMARPRYGVVAVVEALGRYVHMAYIENDCLECMDLSYRYYDLTSGWRVIDWTRPVQPSDLPEGYGLLTELSDALHALDEQDIAAIDSLFFGVLGEEHFHHVRKVFRAPEPIPLAELLDD